MVIHDLAIESVHHHTKRDDYEHRSNQAEFLTQDGENEVRVRLCQVVPLFLRGSRPHARQAART